MTGSQAGSLDIAGAADADDAPDELLAQWIALRESHASEAREAIFVHYMGYARSIAASFMATKVARSAEYDDILQLAYIGLIESIGRFDPSRGVRFTTFCTPRIRGAILNGLENLSETQEQLSFDRRRKADRLDSLRGERRGLQRLQTLGELTAGLAIGFMLEGTGMFVPSESQPSPYADSYETAEWQHLGHRLSEAMTKLSPNELKVISFHYFNAIAFEQIATLLGLSKGRISQLHRTGLGKLREALPPDTTLQITG
ncbi:MAG: RNA polymerase sigma-D factor [Luteibacter sp.]|uniref:sigma-70 family RNA polymerase sigma factor n=1 Tax=Luteibacter sp. TaxID=1886636 RepID=UPI001381533D|nr:sigma-70 family RNA polymerase sigma factor [Luteibacter sp.]KAF1004666.1 MAG: RNA polymerase sigma-D factor [Luteibacter sp.]